MTGKLQSFHCTNKYCKESAVTHNFLPVRVRSVLFDLGQRVKTIIQRSYLSRVMRKPAFWFPTLFDTNQAMQLQKMARVLKFRI